LNATRQKNQRMMMTRSNVFNLRQPCVLLSTVVLALAGCDGEAPAPELTQHRASIESPDFDNDGDGVGGIYDCDDADPSLPASCPMEAPEPGRPVWCDDGLAVPESRSLMNWVNHLEFVDGREKGLREYLYTPSGEDQIPAQCNIALLATRGGPQDASTEQLTRYVVVGAGDDAVGYVLGGRSFWPHNAEHWDFPNHAIDTSCASSDGRTRLRDIEQNCTTAITLRRTSPWDPCGSQYDGRAILIGGGQSASEYPKADLIAALEQAISHGLLGDVDEVVDIDSLPWYNECRAGFGARGCCHIANRSRQYSGHPGVQLILTTNILTYGPACKHPEDLLHKYECSDLSSRPALEALGDVLRSVLNNEASISELLAGGAKIGDLIALLPLSDSALLTIIAEGKFADEQLGRLLEAASPLSDRVLVAATEKMENEGVLSDLLIGNSPLSVDTLVTAVAEMDQRKDLLSVLLANSPGLPEAVLIDAISALGHKDEVRELLLANGPLSNEALLAAIQIMGNVDETVDVLLDNCDLTETVWDAAQATLSRKRHALLFGCGP
jgi:hypothetical protein